MGQYYRPNINGIGYDSDLYTEKNKKSNTFYGQKLTEHAYIDDEYAIAAMKLIINKPSTLYWVGDYANEIEGTEDIYNATWRTKKLKHLKLPDSFDMKKYIAVNHTKHEFIDISKYADITHSYDNMVFNPVCILCAIGNGHGGGDYRDVNSDKAGYWAGDTISLETEIPTDFTDMTEDFFFCEWEPVSQKGKEILKKHIKKG